VFLSKKRLSKTDTLIKALHDTTPKRFFGGQDTSGSSEGTIAHLSFGVSPPSILSMVKELDRLHSFWKKDFGCMFTGFPSLIQEKGVCSREQIVFQNSLERYRNVTLLTYAYATLLNHLNSSYMFEVSTPFHLDK
jgi:hypothetical protein